MSTPASPALTPSPSLPAQTAIDNEQDKAARVLQARFRSYYHERERKGMNISASARWDEVYKTQRRKSIQQEASPDGKKDPTSRWQRGAFFAARLGEPRSASSDDASRQLGAPIRRTKTMDIRYWLEMVDQKHRYGSNLKDYHAYWNTNYCGDQNFFYWLDHGEGKELDLQESPRDRLEREQIIYLNIDQRLNYLVHITPEGKLVWAKDGRPVDTARGKHRDLGNGLGIADLTEQEFQEAQARGEIPTASDSSSSFDSSSSILEEEAHHYTQGPRSPNLRTRIKRRFDPKAIMDVLLRKTLNANTWIFVADNHGHLYVGLKQTGKFQHSSFLCGSEVLAAGLLRVHQGQLTSLSPLSGHYRAGSEQFKEFLDVLEHDWGCDLSKVLISKSLFMIRGLEKYGELSKRKEKVKSSILDRLHIGGRRKKEEAQESKEAEDDLPAQLAAQRLRDREERIDSRQRAEVAIQAGKTERQNIKTAVGQGKKLDPTTDLPSLPYEGMTKESMTDHQRIERGAALIVRAMSRPMKSS